MSKLVTPAKLKEMQDLLQQLGARAKENPPPREKMPKCARCDDTQWIVTPRGAERCPSCWFGIAELGAPTAPKKFHDALMSNYEPLPGNATAIKYAKEWLNQTTGDLFFYGTVGCGKTRLAVSLLNEVYRSTRAGMFIRVSGMLFSLQPGHSEAERKSLWTRLVTAPVLVLDEVASEKEEASDFTLRTLLNLYEERWDIGGRTIWTSNKDLEGLSKQMADDKLSSRISGRATVIWIQTSDQRMERGDL